MGWAGGRDRSPCNPLGRRAQGRTSGGLPSRLSGVEAMTQCGGSLMTQARAGGQTDIFSKEKFLWGPPSGTSLPSTSCRGRPRPRPPNLGTQLLTRNTGDQRALGGEEGTLPNRTAKCALAHARGLWPPLCSGPRSRSADSHPGPHPRRPGTRWPRALPAHARAVAQLPAPPGGHPAARLAGGDCNPGPRW